VEEPFYRRLAEHAGVPYVGEEALERLTPVATLTPSAARALSVVPIEDDGDVLVVATPDPAAVDVAALGALTRRAVRVVVAAPSAVARALARLLPAEQLAEQYATPAATEAEREEYRQLARHAGLEFVELDGTTGPEQEHAAQLLGANACAALGVVPLRADAEEIVVAVRDPGAPLELAVVAAFTGLRPRPVIAAPSDLDASVARIFGPAEEPEEQPRRLGELLMTAGLITEIELAEALARQRATGDRLGQVLLSMGAVGERDLARAFARQLALPELDVARFEPDETAIRVVPEVLARRHRFAPVAIRDHVLYLATADAVGDEALRELRRHTQLPVRLVAAPRSSIEYLLQRIYRTKYTEIATVDLYNRVPDESAHSRVSHGQLLALVLVASAFALSFVYGPIQTLIAFNIASVLFYTSFSLYKFFLIGKALRSDLELPITAEDIEALDAHELPVYTILVPLYREAAVVPRLIDGISKLDYPSTKLDVKLLVEEDDDETLHALRAIDLPAYFKLVVVPDSQPKTKPKACNYGLIQAEGKYVVIYDAEDRPDRDQLKKVISAFARVDARIVCIQCKLNYFNRTQNILTRWFTAEYSHWFDLLMPGLDASDAPIPLGGTSNHFIREKLVELGAWDPFNVTEDADLGIRLHRAGYKTAIVDSTTFEEANSDLYNWIRQRSRWVKGYIQTWLVHMRHPLKLQRQIGWRNWWSFQFVIGGTFVSFLLNPIYWGMTSIWLMTRAHVINEIFPTWIYYTGAFGLFLGNFVFTYINVAGCMRRGHYDLVKYALLSPIYWALMSVGAWKGFVQLLYRPHYWEKTVHGLDVGVEPEYVHGAVQ
jgi:cellulose synthase/poly-beta-1,6-N-acetylglucosamine synthase-like glycosyltransferase